jgi:hypothetical protein
LLTCGYRAVEELGLIDRPGSVRVCYVVEGSLCIRVGNKGVELNQQDFGFDGS